MQATRSIINTFRALRTAMYDARRDAAVAAAVKAADDASCAAAYAAYTVDRLRYNYYEDYVAAHFAPHCFTASRAEAAHAVFDAASISATTLQDRRAMSTRTLYSA